MAGDDCIESPSRPPRRLRGVSLAAAVLAALCARLAAAPVNDARVNSGPPHESTRRGGGGARNRRQGAAEGDAGPHAYNRRRCSLKHRNCVVMAVRNTSLAVSWSLHVVGQRDTQLCRPKAMLARVDGQMARSPTLAGARDDPHRV